MSCHVITAILRLIYAVVELYYHANIEACAKDYSVHSAVAKAICVPHILLKLIHFMLNSVHVHRIKCSLIDTFLFSYLIL